MHGANTGIKYILVTAFAAVALATACTTKKATSTPKEPVVKNNKSVSPTELKLKGFFIDGCREKMKGNLETAENLFKECLKIDPTNAAANYELGNIYRFSGLNDQAIKCSKVAALADPKNEWYNLLYIECLHNKRMYNEAINRYESLISIYPYRADFFQGLATECVYAGKTEKAIQAYTRMEQRIGVNENISIRKVKLYKQLKKWSEAEAEIKKLMQEDPKEVRYFSYLAELYQEQGQFQKAMDTYKEVLKTDSTNPYIHLALADFYRQQKLDDKFFSELKTAFVHPDLDIDNKVKILMSYYAVTEVQPKYLGQAYELCKLLVDSNPSEPKAHSVYSDFLFRDNKIKEARLELLKVLEFDKSKYEIWQQLLKCESDLNEVDSMLVHSATAMELFPNQPVPYFLNGVAYMKLKQYKKAVAPLREGREFVYEDPRLLLQFYSNLAETYNALEEYEKSDKEFDKAIELSPDEAYILNNYAYYLALRKQKLEKAEKLSKHSLEINPSSVSFLDTYGWILFVEGKYSEAKSYFEKAMDKGGDSRAAIVEHYGDVLFKVNEVDKAVENWKKSLDLGNTSPILKKKIADKKYYE
ncbi:MAG: tetratricopeptide repeat protein [Bacteroidia bacterium]